MLERGLFSGFLLGMHKAIFLDRDGTLNTDSKNYIKSLDEFVLFPYTIPALKIFQDLGYKIVIITNQACVGKGLTTRAKVEEIHEYLLSEAKNQGINIAGIYYCPHRSEDNCTCRKPQLQNVLLAANEHGIDLARSYFIGDSPRDIETGNRAGCRTIFIRSGVRRYSAAQKKAWAMQPDYETANVLTAAQLLDRIEKKE